MPPGCPHAIRGHGQPEGDAAASARTRSVPGLPRFEAGPADAQRVRVACGTLRARYAGGVGVFDLMPAPLVVDFAASREMRDTFQRLLAESRRRSPGSRAMLGVLMQQCLVLVFRELCEDGNCRVPWLRGLDDPRLRDAIAAVLEHPDAAHSVKSLASVARMSRSAFARDFVDGPGCTPKSFVHQVRMGRAAEMLRSTDLTVTAVAHRVGFSSRSHFCRMFTERSTSRRRATGRHTAAARSRAGPPADGRQRSPDLRRTSEQMSGAATRRMPTLRTMAPFPLVLLGVVVLGRCVEHGWDPNGMETAGRFMVGGTSLAMPHWTLAHAATGSVDEAG